MLGTPDTSGMDVSEVAPNKGIFFPELGSALEISYDSKALLLTRATLFLSQSQLLKLVV